MSASSRADWWVYLPRVSVADVLAAGACLDRVSDFVSRYGGMIEWATSGFEDLSGYVARVAHSDGSSLDPVYGVGCNDGAGDGQYGYGYGSGEGRYGYSHEDGSGCGTGSDYGNGDAEGDGTGFGEGYGCGDATGDGYSWGSDVPYVAPGPAVRAEIRLRPFPTPADGRLMAATIGVGHELY